MQLRTTHICWLMLLGLVCAEDAWGQRRGDRVNPYEKVSDVYREFWRKGELAKALDNVDTAIRNSADSVPVYWLTDRAELFFLTGQVARAIDEIEWLQYRRPSPVNAWQLARFYRASGRMNEFRSTLEDAWQRARRFQRDDLETDEALAINAIAEVRGENPRTIFQSILNGKMKTEEDRLLRYVAAGELAYRKFDYALAASYFEKALEENESYLPALGGLANCFWKSHDARLSSTLDKIAAINPHYPDAKAIQVERDLDANDVDLALVKIESQLARNPLDLRFLGLKLAAYFLQDNQPGQTALEAEILAYNPHASQVYRIAGRIASRHYRFKEGAEFQKKALEANPENSLARAFYAQDLLRMGQDVEGRKALEQAFASDRYNVQVFNILEMMDKVADFETKSQGPFQLRMPKKELPIWGVDALDLLQDAYDRYTEKYKVKLQTPIAVQIFDDHDDFMVRSVGLPGSAGHLGICFGQLITMDSPTARSPGAMNWRSVLLHEFVHVVTLQKTENRMSRWLSEGISVYEQGEVDPSWAHGLEMDYKWIVAADGIPGASDLERLFTQPKTNSHLMFGYFAAGEFVRYYVENHGIKALNNAMELMAEGNATLVSLVLASGKTEKDFDTQFKKFMEKRFEPFAALPKVNQDFVDALKASAADFRGQPFENEPGPFHEALRQATEAVSKQDWETAEKGLWKAYELYPDYRGPDAPLPQLAELYTKLDRKQDLEKVLQKAIASEETGLWACRKLCQLFEASGRWSDLMAVTRQALDIDPFDIGLNRLQLKALGHLDRGEDQLRVLRKLVDLDKDRAVTYRLDYIDLLIKRGNGALAKEETLDLLEEMPSSWDAQRRLLTLVEGKDGEGGRRENPP